MAGTGQYSYSVIRGFRRQDGRNRSVQLYSYSYMVNLHGM